MGIQKKLYTKLSQDKSIILKLVMTSAARAVSAGGTFVFNFVLARFLGVEDFGHFMLGYTIIIGLGFLVRFGLGSAILRFGGIMFSKNRFGQIKKLRRDVTVFCLLTSLVLGILLFFSKNILMVNFFDGAEIESMLLYFAIALPFYSFLMLQSSFFKAFKRPEIAPFFEVGLVTLLTGGIVFVFSLYNVTIDSSIASQIFLGSSILIVLMGYVVLSSLIKRNENGAISPMENYDSFLGTLPDYALSNIISYILKFSPIIFLGLYHSGTDVGLFSIANSIAFVINFILWIVNAVYAPYFASLYNDNKMSELQQLLRNSVLYMMFIAIPIFILIVLFPSAILSFFGADFTGAKSALLILAVAQLFNTLTGPLFFLLNMTGHEKKLRNIIMITGLVTVGACFSLIPKFSYNGAAIAAAIGLLLQNSVAFYTMKKYLKISLF